MPELRRRSTRRGGRRRSKRTLRSSTVVPATVAKRRFSMRRPRLQMARLVALALLAGFIALTLFLFVDERFYVRDIQINGLGFSSRGDIERLAAVDDFSLFWVDRRQVAKRIESLPFVKHAQVQVVLPDRVRIDLVERQPLALWRVQGKDAWVDGEGTLLPVVAQLQGLPVLQDLDGSSVDSAGRVAPELVAGVQQLQDSLPQVGSFSYDRPRGLHFMLDAGTTVVLGQPRDLSRRVTELLALQAGLATNSQRVTEINLQVDDGYFYRLTP